MIFKKRISRYFRYISAILVSGAGFLYGYDMLTLKIVFMMDAFRICFGLAKWDGNYRDDDGTLLTLLNNGANPKYRYLVETDDNNFIEGIVTAGYVFGTICGALLSSYLGDKYGRRKSIIISSAIFSLGSLMLAGSLESIITVTLGRFIMGLSIGSFTVICPVYIAELAPANLRGEISYLYYMFMILGIISSSVFNVSIMYSMNVADDYNSVTNNSLKTINNTQWRLAFLIQFFFGLIYTGLSYIVPKSPRWLCYNERNVEALHTMAKIYNTKLNDSKVQDKLEEIQNDAIINRAIGHSKYSELFIPSIRRRTFNIIFMNCIQQWTGILLYLCFETRIYSEMGGSEFESTIVLPIMMFFIVCSFIAFVCFSLIDRYGRKSLLLVGTLLMLLINLINIFSFPFSPEKDKLTMTTPMYVNLNNCDSGLKSSPPFHHDPQQNIDFFSNQCHTYVYHCRRKTFSFSSDKKIQSLPMDNDMYDTISNICKIYENSKSHTYTIGVTVSNIMLFICIYISTWLPVPFIYKAEIFPLRIRSKGSAIGTITNRMNYLLVMILCPYLYKIWGAKIFILFTITCFVGSIFSIVSCTECKSIPLEKMEEKMSGKIIEF